MNQRKAETLKHKTQNIQKLNVLFAQENSQALLKVFFLMILLQFPPGDALPYPYIVALIHVPNYQFHTP